MTKAKTDDKVDFTRIDEVVEDLNKSGVLA